VQRRTWLQSLAAFLVVHPWTRLRAFAQAPPLTELQIATLHGIAEVVLPSELRPVERRAIVNRFALWVRNYREQADRGHSYGSSRLAEASGPSPARQYPPQFEALDRAAAGSGATTFAALSADARRTLIEAALNGPPVVTRLPTQPTGANVIADFMGFYFNSPAAYDLCYQREILAEQCRELAGSENLPARRTTGGPP
jgi:hypothetical protein